MDKITESQAKTLKLFSYYCMSHGSSEVNYDIYVSDGSNDWQEDYCLGTDGTRIELYEAISNVINELCDEHNLYDSIDSDTRGNLRFNFDCKERKLKVTASEVVMGNNEMGDEKLEDDLPSPVIEFLNELKSEGVSEGTVEFNGGGDSGEIYDSLETEKGSFKIERGVEDFLYRWLGEFYGGWEINEGSHGDFVFYTDNNSVQLNFNEHTEDEEDLGQVFYTQF